MSERRLQMGGISLLLYDDSFIAFVRFNIIDFVNQ